MKSYTNLFEKVIDFENLWRAYRRARKGKRSRPDVAAFEYRLEGELCALRVPSAPRSLDVVSGPGCRISRTTEDPSRIWPVRKAERSDEDPHGDGRWRPRLQTASEVRRLKRQSNHMICFPEGKRIIL